MPQRAKTSDSKRRALQHTTVLLLAAGACLLSGCASVSYYAQAIGGQLELWRMREPLAAVLSREDPASPLHHKLTEVVRAREFAARELALPSHGSYQHYVALERDFVVWNVFAAPPLSLQPLQSCFLFAGCLSYRGFFARAGAEAWAAQQRAAGMETYLGGVAAYSTLGWFDDPVLSSMLNAPLPAVIDTLFHELAHQRFYLPGDTEFNESFAVAVARAGLRRFYGDRQTWQALVGAREREDEVLQLVLDARAEIEALFAGSLPDADKLTARERIFERLRQRYRDRRGPTADAARYDAWMLGEWNNAKLGSVAIYHGLADGFAALLQRCGNDLPRFYLAVERLAGFDQRLRHACLGSAPAAAAGGACRSLCPSLPATAGDDVHE